MEGRSFAEGVFELELKRQEGHLCVASGRKNNLYNGKRTQRSLPFPADQLRAIGDCKIGLVIKISIAVEQQNPSFCCCLKFFLDKTFISIPSVHSETWVCLCTVKQLNHAHAVKQLADAHRSLVYSELLSRIQSGLFLSPHHFHTAHPQNLPLLSNQNSIPQ